VKFWKIKSPDSAGGILGLPAQVVISCDDIDLLSTNVWRSGAFSNIYLGKCRLEQGSQMVAIKKVRHVSDSKADRIRRLFREFMIWRNLDHPYILPLRGIVRTGSRSFPVAPCLVLPYLPKGNVREVIKKPHSRNPFNKMHSLRRKWVAQIACGLLYMHRQDIAHGDLRGANILISDDMRVQITDFGLSVYDSGSAGGYMSSRTPLYPWAPPEYLNLTYQSDRQTKQGDIWAFGCVCIELYTGKDPFAHVTNGESATALAARIRGGELPALYAPKTMSNHLWRIIKNRCWGKEDARIDAHHLVYALRAANFSPTGGERWWERRSLS